MDFPWKFGDLLIFWLFFLRLHSGTCIEITTLKVDSPMVSGDNGWLKCDWDSKNEPLYSVKWYWGTSEFYRWSPKAENPTLTFNISAFVVDRDKSRKGHVFVRNISLRANGVLRCEVSGEGPTFKTDHKDVNLRVVDLPDDRPMIQGSGAMYSLHQMVALTCTSASSKPAAHLDFYINDEKAEKEWLTPQHPRVDEMTDLETATLGLRFSLHPRLVHDGRVKIKCTASIDDFYWDSSHMYVTVEGQVPQRASRMEERATATTNNSVSWHSSLGCALCHVTIVLLLQRLLSASL